MEKPLLIVSDIEGCWNDKKGKPFPGAQLDRVKSYCEMARKGKLPPLVLCTGRGPGYCEPILQMMDAYFPGVYSVTENGAFLLHFESGNEFLVPNPAMEGKMADLSAAVQSIKIRFVAGGLARLEYGKEICVSLNPTTVSGSTVAQLYEMVKDELLETGWISLVNVTHSNSAVDITPSGVNKGSGVRFMSEKCGISLEDMAGIGDSKGDWPMLELVGHPCCVGNADEATKELVRSRGGYVATDHNAKGAIEILKSITGWREER